MSLFIIYNQTYIKGIFWVKLIENLGILSIGNKSKVLVNIIVYILKLIVTLKCS